jgi:hypothetical protein
MTRLCIWNFEAVFVERFVKALSIGDLSQLLEVLSSEAVLYLDGGGKVKAPKLQSFQFSVQTESVVSL